MPDEDEAQPAQETPSEQPAEREPIRPNPVEVFEKGGEYPSEHRDE